MRQHPQGRDAAKCYAPASIVELLRADIWPPALQLVSRRAANRDHGRADAPVPASGNAPLWMNNKLAWADRLIAVISPDYVPARYSPMQWASQIWNDPDGTKGSVVPVIVRPTSKMPPLLKDLSRVDLTNCSEAEAKRRLIEDVDMPAPPERKPAFERIEGDPPDRQHTGPPEKPTFAQVNVPPRSLKISVAIAALALAIVAVFAVLAFFGDHATERECKTIIGGMVVCGDYKDQRVQDRH
jgi:TIR domain